MIYDKGQTDNFLIICASVKQLFNAMLDNCLAGVSLKYANCVKLSDEYGRKGPLTVSENYNSGIGDTLINGASELGISVNPSYNSGINNGMTNSLFHFTSCLDVYVPIHTVYTAMLRVHRTYLCINNRLLCTKSSTLFPVHNAGSDF